MGSQVRGARCPVSKFMDLFDTALQVHVPTVHFTLIGMFLVLPNISSTRFMEAILPEREHITQKWRPDRRRRACCEESLTLGTVGIWKSVSYWRCPLGDQPRHGFHGVNKVLMSC